MTPYVWSQFPIKKFPKINALICTYNCSDTIEHTLNSLLGRVNSIIILDNKWVGVKDNSNSINSNDNTLPFIMHRWSQEHFEQQLILIIYYERQLHQFEARNILLDYVPEGEWFLVIDSDEVITRWDNKIKDRMLFSSAKGFRVKGIYGLPLPNVRLMRKTKGLHYTKNHRFLEDHEGEVHPENFPVCDIQIEHHPKAKTKKMRKIMEEYENWLYNWEKRNS